MYKPILLLPLVALALAGCQTQKFWHLNHNSLASFHQHDAQCRQWAESMSNHETTNQSGKLVGQGVSLGSNTIALGGIFLMAAERARIEDLYDGCMMQQGYTRPN